MEAGKEGISVTRDYKNTSTASISISLFCSEVYMSKKTVVSVYLLCSKCKKKVMESIAGIEGINSIALDSSKCLATVIGDADPATILGKVRKFRRSAAFVSIGPPKEEKKDDKKDPVIPKTCQRCEIWYVVAEDYYSPCSIL